MRLIPASVLAVLLLSACASTGTFTGHDNCSRLDCAKMAAIDYEARMNGVDVYWVHPPERLRTQTR